MVAEEQRDDLETFQQRIGYQFHDLTLLERALTHKSYANEKGQDLENNERLEFLGDAVIDLIIIDYALKGFPTFSEGELSKLKGALVSETSLAKIARAIGLGQVLRLGKGEERTGGRKKDSLLANSLEAIVAAIYLDCGFEQAYPFIVKLFKDDLEEITIRGGHWDFKSEVQEYIQNRLGSLPSYRVVREEGPDHEKTFEVELLVDGQVYGSGKGRNKKEAEQQAARQVLEKFSSP